MEKYRRILRSESFNNIFYNAVAMIVAVIDAFLLRAIFSKITGITYTFAVNTFSVKAAII